MTKIKRMCALLLALCMAFSLCFVIGCKKDNGTDDDTDAGADTGTITMAEVKENYESHGYEIDEATASELEQLAGTARAAYDIRVTFVDCIEAYKHAENDEYIGAEIYELETGAQAQEFYAKLSDEINTHGGGVVSIDGKIVFFCSSNDVLEQAFSKGNDSGNANTNTNTGADSASFTIEIAKANYESNGYTVTEYEASMLGTLASVLNNAYGTSVTFTGVISVTNSAKDFSYAIVYECETRAQAEEFLFSIMNDASYSKFEIQGNVVIAAISQDVITHGLVANSNDGSPDEIKPQQGNKVGDLCYSYDLRIVDATGVTGEYINREDTVGKVTIINFWGTWCNPCVNELRHFDEIASEYADSVAFIAVHSVSASNSAAGFISQNYSSSNIIFALDDRGENGDVYYKMLGGDTFWPYTVVLDENGTIVSTHIGALSYEQTVAAIEAAQNNG